MRIGLPPEDASGGPLAPRVTGDSRIDALQRVFYSTDALIFAKPAYAWLPLLGRRPAPPIRDIQE
jgi:hypothetical protein